MKKSKTHFRFKQFTVHHDQCAMKVGTDSVVLGAWARIEQVRRIIDIGTGCGVLALMLAQRSPAAVIDAIEVDDQSAIQAAENVARSPWANRIQVHHTAIQNFTTRERYDMAISNPPFFNDSLEPPDARRLLSRHTVKLTNDELIETLGRLITQDGRFSVILPFTEGNNFIRKALNHDFHCTRRFGFRTRSGKPVTRWLLEFSGNQEPIQEGELLLYDEALRWSDDYARLTRDFYLKL